MPDLKDSLVNSLVGAGSALDGDLDVEGMLRVDGDLRGSIRATGKVVVGETGRVEASIRARSAIIGGLVKGDVYVAESLRLLSGAEVVGAVFASRLEAEEGAMVHGELLVTGRPESAESELTAFVERRGAAARFLGAFRSADFIRSAEAPRPAERSRDAASETPASGPAYSWPPAAPAAEWSRGLAPRDEESLGPAPAFGGGLDSDKKDPEPGREA